jgi:polyhydroxybutyrate depolymerase
MTSLLLVLSLVAADPLGPGDHYLSVKVDGRNRSYLVHVPEKYSGDKATPVVLVFHGAGTNAAIMVPFCGMNEEADEQGFIAVYPNGTGIGILQTFNSGGILGALAEKQPDDVKFVSAMLDDLATVVNVDTKRVYATGISNGGMMCYRLAAELSDRIAAIAPVSGTMGIDEAKPKRPVPIMHFHGSADRVVPFYGPGKSSPKYMTLKYVDDSIRTWVKINKCKSKPIVEKLEDKADDGTAVTKNTYAAAKDGAEVILIEIEGGGHTWPGKRPPVWYLGKSTKDISANDMIWEFFQRHRLP